MELYNVELTEKEIRVVGELRWQKASWKRSCLYAAGSIALWLAITVLTVGLTEWGVMRNIGVLAAVIPIVILAIWYLVRLGKEGRKFLEYVKGNK